MRHSCPLCKSAETKLVFRSILPFSIRSDWIPVATPTEIWGCAQCGHVFKPDSFTHSSVDYVNYSVMDNDPAVDKLEFANEQPVGRSETIIAYLRACGLYREGQRILDYGCNRGAFLARLPPGSHAGFEVSVHYQSVIEGLGLDFFSPQAHPRVATYDGVTLIHVLEHLQDIESMLQPAIAAAKHSAYFLIQVPDLKNQISDAYVVDHCSHFFESTLTQALKRSGLILVGEVQRIIPGELTGVFRLEAVADGVSGSEQPWERIHAELRSRLQETESKIQSLQCSAEPVVIYGAGLLGSLLGAVLGAQVHSYVDDNPHYQGRKMLNHPIYSVDELSGWRGPVALAVPPSVYERVAQKCLDKGLRPEKLFASDRWPM